MSTLVIEQKVAATPGYAWIILAVAYIAGCTAALTMLKVPPLMPILQNAFKVNMSSAGLLMSVFSLTGVLLALPAGVIIKRFGLKLVGIFAMSCNLAGCLMGALSTSYVPLLTSRVIEGAGFALMAVLGATAVGTWFPREKVALPMGILGTSIGIGGAFVMVVGPRMAHNMGWQSVWWLGAALSLVSLVLVAVFLRMPDTLFVAGAPILKIPSVGEGLANKNIWLLTAVFFCYNIPTGAVFTFYATFLTKVYGFTMERAAMMTSLGMVGSLIGAPLGGYLLIKIGHFKRSLTISLVLLGLLFLLPFHITGAMIPIWWVLVGMLVMGFIPTLCMTAVPGIMGKPQLIGIGIAVIGLGGNASGIVGPPFFGAIVEKAGWNAGAYALIPLILLGIIATRMTKFAE